MGFWWCKWVYRTNLCWFSGLLPGPKIRLGGLGSKSGTHLREIGWAAWFWFVKWQWIYHELPLQKGHHWGSTSQIWMIIKQYLKPPSGASFRIPEYCNLMVSNGLGIPYGHGSKYRVWELFSHSEVQRKTQINGIKVTLHLSYESVGALGFEKNETYWFMFSSL